jgi:hypothetical protein
MTRDNFIIFIKTKIDKKRRIVFLQNLQLDRTRKESKLGQAFDEKGRYLCKG